MSRWENDSGVMALTEGTPDFAVVLLHVEHPLEILDCLKRARVSFDVAVHRGPRKG